MINIDGKEYRNLQEQVEKNMEDIAALNRNLYMHTIVLSAKLYNAGVESNTFITSIRFRYFNNDATKLKADDLETMLADVRVIVSGFARDTTTEKEYIPYDMYLDDDKIYVGMATAYYSPAGAISSQLGTVTSFVDKVVKLI